jgi:hypothetical protein
VQRAEADALAAAAAVATLLLFLSFPWPPLRTTTTTRTTTKKMTKSLPGGRNVPETAPAFHLTNTDDSIRIDKRVPIFVPGNPQAFVIHIVIITFILLTGSVQHDDHEIPRTQFGDMTGDEPL